MTAVFEHRSLLEGIVVEETSLSVWCREMVGADMDVDALLSIAVLISSFFFFFFFSFYSLGHNFILCDFALRWRTYLCMC